MRSGRLTLAAIITATVAVLAPTAALAWEGLPPYAAESDLLATTPSTDDGAIGAMFNPAQWGVLEKPELSFFWNDDNVRSGKMDNWGFAAGEGLGFTLRRHDVRTPTGPKNVTDYQIGMGSGSGDHYGGFAFGFSGSGKAEFKRDNYLSFGDIARPNRFLSMGSTGRIGLSHGDLDATVDVGIRPLGDPRITLFGDYSISRGDRLDDGPLAGGVEVRPIPGIQAALRYGDRDEIQVTLGVTLQRSGFRATPRYDSEGDLGATRYVARAGAPVKGIDLDGRRNKNRRFLDMDLKGRVAYQAYKIGDEGTLPLRTILERLQFAVEDPTVGGVVINLSGMEANPTMTWEIREKLLALKARGKKVIVYADNLKAAGYYLASTADKLVMDPQGSLLLPGMQISRTYYKGLLAKLGLGFDEWRYYKYKSALEAFSREKMSDADKEQLQELVVAAYDELARGAVSSGRATRAKFDDVVDGQPYLRASRLLDLGWVDALGRPEDLNGVVKMVGGRRAVVRSPSTVQAIRYQPEETWGPIPTIALVYAVGECAMDEGIKARKTSKAMRAFRKSNAVDAVVVRADSPGGDPLASDLVANEIRALKRAKKPVLVSQGRVAASGGYWISMDGDSIFTTPFTVTGSIGVIGGWVWNDGFGKKYGFASDHVQVGRSADLMGGIRLPFLGANLPERNLTDSERKQIEIAFGDLYGDFTKMVSTARRIDLDTVRELGEGRVYLGRRASATRLVDRIGGLDDTIEAAKRAAGIPANRKVRVVEYPKPGLIRLPAFLGGAKIGGDSPFEALAGGKPLSYDARVLQEILDHPGQPLLLTPSEWLPAEEEALP